MRSGGGICSSAATKRRTVGSNLQNMATSLDEAGQQFVLWSLATLKLSFEQDGAATYVLSVPEPHREALGGETVTFRFQRNGRNPAQPVECLTLDSQLVGWLFDQLRLPGGVQHGVPSQQPVGVHQITQKIFAAYEVEGGSVHLSGCTLEDRPLLRVTRLKKSNEGDATVRLAHAFYTTQGTAVGQETVRSLGLARIEPVDVVPRLADDELQRWLAAVEMQTGASEGNCVVTTLVWCKHAEGKIAFAIGDVSAEQTFSGWAQQLVDGSQSPPPFRCPETDQLSYRLALTDDGRLAVAEAIDVCEESGQRVLVTELETCSITEKRAAAPLLDRCPVTGQRLLRRAFVSCAMCGQLVSPQSIRNGHCAACRALQPVSKDDPRMARVMDQYPKLDRWRRWRIAETARAYILMAGSMIKRLLVVVEKESLGLVRVAIGSRFSSHWSEAPSAEREDYLKSSK